MKNFTYPEGLTNNSMGTTVLVNIMSRVDVPVDEFRIRQERPITFWIPLLEPRFSNHTRPLL